MKHTAIIGCGNMGEAILKGLIAGGAAAGSISVSEPAAARRRQLKTRYGVAVSAGNVSAAKGAHTIIIAVKPNVVPQVLTDLKPLVTKDNPLLISIAAGVSTAKILESAGEKARVVRVMPNTPALVGEGMTVLCSGGTATGKDIKQAEELFGSVGQVLVMEERLMDAVTGLSGSGPAYVFLMIEALADGGVKNGIPRDQALTLARQTVLGAARLAVATGEHPGVLKDRVTSPGGTTIAGITALERGRFRASLIDAVTSAAERSEELGGRR